MMTGVPEIDNEGFDVLCDISERLKIWIFGKALAGAKRGFHAWATKMWKTTPGVLHRCAKGTIGKPGEIAPPTTVYSSPIEAMGHRADKWQKIWSSPTFNPAEVFKSVGYVNLRAKKEELLELSVGVIRPAVASMIARKSKGAGLMGPVEVR
eukprot:136192-Pyramimonas_sp.AAC.1